MLAPLKRSVCVTIQEVMKPPQLHPASTRELAPSDPC
jgi:hypothetical protein